MMNKEKITDGLQNTFWHSDKGTSWMNYELNTIQTITKVTVGLRLGRWGVRQRYKNMFVTLIGENEEKLAEKFTTGVFGEPFLDTNYENIIVPFDFIRNVKSIKVSFRDGKFGQIRTLIVEGNSGSIFNFFSKTGGNKQNHKIMLSKFVERRLNSKNYFSVDCLIDHNCFSPSNSV